MDYMINGETATGRATPNSRARTIAPFAAALLQLCSAAALAQTNLAPAGIAYLWAHNTTATGVTANYNLYYTVDGASAGTWTWLGTAVSGFSSYQSISGMDADSLSRTRSIQA